MLLVSLFHSVCILAMVVANESFCSLLIFFYTLCTRSDDLNFFAQVRYLRGGLKWAIFMKCNYLLLEGLVVNSLLRLGEGLLDADIRRGDGEAVVRR